MFTNNMFCAKSDNGADTCQGDSGGPFMCENADGAWTVSGITSWGRGCAIDGTFLNMTISDAKLH